MTKKNGSDSRFYPVAEAVSFILLPLDLSAVMETEYQNSVLPDCHDVNNRYPQHRIELGEQLLPSGNVPEEAVYRSALDRPCIQQLGDLIEPRLGFFVPLHIAVVPCGEIVPVTVLLIGDA